MQIQHVDVARVGILNNPAAGNAGGAGTRFFSPRVKATSSKQKN
jgi:hypothetical protein